MCLLTKSGDRILKLTVIKSLYCYKRVLQSITISSLQMMRKQCFACETLFCGEYFSGNVPGWSRLKDIPGMEEIGCIDIVKHTNIPTIHIRTTLPALAL
jgi:hypothetical protein